MKSRGEKLVIAIDGEAGSGKSTVAKEVAQRLGFRKLDTGAMYRAITLLAIERGIALSSAAEIEELSRRTEMNVWWEDDDFRIAVDGRDVTTEIRSSAVTAAVSEVSAHEGMRKVLVDKQREIGRRYDIVAEGRDMGTVVFRDTKLKFFLRANDAVRARRRKKDLDNLGEKMDIEKIREDILIRDEKDASRRVAPLKMAEDAFLIDTSDMNVDEVVALILAKVRDHESFRHRRVE
ncbi:MAG: (d)CMP kinase [Planctomycetes bacterium]|nr:(d)CMP kinase [Planctomycetota bacterium]